MENFNPTFWNDSPTAVEQIRFLIKQNLENENKIKSVEDTLQDILKWIENTDSKIKEEVTKVVWQMYENGELQKIIEDVTKVYILDKMQEFPKSQYIDCKRVFSFLSQTYDYATATKSGDYNAEFYTTLQGACHFVRNGTNYNVTYQIQDNAKAPTYYNNMGNLQIFTDDGALIFNGLLQAGHGNAITYDPTNDRLLITWSSEYINSISQSSGKISAISLANGVTGILKNSANQIQATVYDFADYHFSGIDFCENDNKIYAFWQYDCYALDFENLTATLIYNLNGRIGETAINSDLLNPLSGSYYNTNQNASIIKDYIFYLRFNPNIIIRYNRQLNIFDCVYEIPRTLDNKQYLAGECESISADESGKFYIFCYSEMGHRTISMFKITQCFVGNFKYPAVAPTLSLEPGANVNAKPYGRTIYVDYPHANANPTGSKDNPFRNVAEACWYINNAEWCTNKLMYVNIIDENTPSGDYHSPIWINSNSSGVVIRPNDESTHPSIGNVFGEGDCNIILVDVNVINRIPKNAPTQPFESSTLIGIRNGATLRMSAGCKLNNEYGNKATVKYGIYSQYSTVVLNEGGTLPTKDRWASGAPEGTRQLTYGTCSIICSHGLYPSSSFNILN